MMLQLSIADVPLGNISEIRQQLDDAMIRPATSTDLDLVRAAIYLASQLDSGYAAIIRDRAELLAGKLENDRYDIAVKLGLTV